MNPTYFKWLCISVPLASFIAFCLNWGAIGFMLIAIGAVLNLVLTFKTKGSIHGAVLLGMMLFSTESVYVAIPTICYLVYLHTSQDKAEAPISA